MSEGLDNNYQVKVYLDEKTFYNFAWFDMLVVKRRILPQILFFLIMVAFSCIAFWRASVTVEGTFLGNALLVIGVIVPLAYMVSFYFSLQDQAKKLNLVRPQYVYTLSISGDTGLTVEKGEQKAVIPWKVIYALYHRKGCSYIYVNKSQAYLLPYRNVRGNVDKLCALLDAKIPNHTKRRMEKKL